MALKKHLNEDERLGLTDEEIKLAERYLRRHKTKGAIQMPEAMSVYELVMLGHTITEIHYQNPQWPIGKIALTIALNRWMHDKRNVMRTLRDQVNAKVAKSILDSVNFLTAMLSVANTEHLYQMHAYLRDPDSNPKPALRIESLKEYKEMMESLQKLMSGAVSSVKKGGASALFDAVDQRLNESMQAYAGRLPAPSDDDNDEYDEMDVQALLAEVVDGEEE